jgi:DNA-binding IscR family transcriptional regulator
MLNPMEKIHVDTGLTQGEAALANVLEQLWQMAQETPSKPCSLARASKRTRRPMSALMRQLGLLSDAGWVEVTVREAGGGSVTLTAAGYALCAGWFGV